MYEVHYNDNSDHGRAVEKFDCASSALAKANALEANPPEGNHFHPAPENLDLSVLRVERIR